MRNLIAKKCRLWKIDSQRIEILEDNGADQIKKQLLLADVFLDSFPYTSSISISEALAAKLPSVSLAGNSYPELLSKTIVSLLDLEEEVLVTTIDSYVDKAVGFGANKRLREESSKKITRVIDLTISKDWNFQFSIKFWEDINFLLFKHSASDH